MFLKSGSKSKDAEKTHTDNKGMTMKGHSEDTGRTQGGHEEEPEGKTQGKTARIW